MTRSFGLTAAALALVVPLSAAPVPKGKPAAAEAQPSAVGTRWEYIRNGNENTVYTEEVTAATEKDGVKSVTVTITDNAGGERVNKFEVRKDGVYLTEATSMTIDTPFPVQKPDAKPGDTWKGSWERNGVTFQYKFTVGQPEELTTPAGKFKATPITRKLTANNVEYVFWYADGVGLVRQTTNGRQAQELKSFTPPKEGKK